MGNALVVKHSGGMTSLHRAAQQVLAENRRVMLPPHPLGFGGGRYNFLAMDLEARVGNRRVDCLVSGEGEIGTVYEKIKLVIEIRVINPVNGEKLAELQEHGLNAVVEIDLRRFSKTEWDPSTLASAVCDSSTDIQSAGPLHDPSLAFPPRAVLYVETIISGPCLPPVSRPLSAIWAAKWRQ